MATLAQEIIETAWKPVLSDIAAHSPAEFAAMSADGRDAYLKDGSQSLEIVQGALKAPPIGASPQQMACHAERYVFDCDGPDQVAQMVEDGMIDKTIPFETAEMPADRVWIEWRVKVARAPEQIKIGVLLDASQPDKLDPPHSHLTTRYIACVSTAKAAARVLFVGYGPPFPMSPGEMRPDLGYSWGLALRWVEGSASAKSPPSIEREIQNIAREAISCLFLLTTPRVCEYREVEWGGKLQAKRAKAKKLPLVEYREVKILVGTSEVRNRRIGNAAAASSPETVSKRRLHRVIGHFRVYGPEGKKRAIWIPQHLRGDASKGILLHNRTVTIGGKK